MNPHKEIKIHEDAQKFIEYWSNRIGFENLYKIVKEDWERRNQ